MRYDPLARLEKPVLFTLLAAAGLTTAVHIATGWVARKLDAALTWIEPWS